MTLLKLHLVQTHAISMCLHGIINICYDDEYMSNRSQPVPRQSPHCCALTLTLTLPLTITLTLGFLSLLFVV